MSDVNPNNGSCWIYGALNERGKTCKQVFGILKSDSWMVFRMLLGVKSVRHFIKCPGYAGAFASVIIISILNPKMGLREE